MTKFCHATILDENDEEVGDLDGMVFPMGGFIAHNNAGRMFVGKIDPTTNKLKEIYEYIYEK